MPDRPDPIEGTQRTMTTYRRADGDLIGGEYGWVGELEWFECNDDPTELVEEVWVLASERTLVAPDVAGKCCTADVDGDWCEADASQWVEVEAGDGDWVPRCDNHINVTLVP